MEKDKSSNKEYKIENSKIKAKEVHQGDKYYIKNNFPREPKKKSKRTWIAIPIIIIIGAIITILFIYLPDFQKESSIPFPKLIQLTGNTLKHKESSIIDQVFKTNDIVSTIDSFKIGKYEVTEQDYHYFIKATNYKPPPYWKNNPPEYYKKSKLPVVEVNWKDAEVYCNWLKEELGLKEVRLPKEEEWETAARGSANNLYPWGDAHPDETKVHFNAGKPTEVNDRNISPTPNGLMHLVGNVEEWCMPSSILERTDCKYKKVVRGGAYNDRAAAAFSCTYYRCVEFDQRAPEIGFRIVVIE